jgi:hypothetical protein
MEMVAGVVIGFCLERREALERRGGGVALCANGVSFGMQLEAVSVMAISAGDTSLRHQALHE